MEKGYSIKSKPIYGTLVWQEHAMHHVVIAEGEGGKALLKLFQQKLPREPLSVLYLAADPQAEKYAVTVQKVVNEPITLSDSQAELLDALKTTLDSCYMGTQFYVAGTEGFIWAVAGVLREAGVDDKNVFKELCGSLGRRLYCVHCKTTNENVHHNIHVCTGCGRHLIVREHFSRLMGAYMGFMIDAEVPGEIPAAEEIYP
ncbi:hypothetical protein E8Q33_10135 [Methylophaga sp. SB9B]|uniref:dimethylamine monooxygenase subunit DmmA family protein n=1 Tax=Methylophaga sp. SB9B TaxID=2570356 RepID=UPI0010A77BE5|nr:dimethylamine monooxygenase subunit DmmA family protein [Methylophaga sp. SB9B]THK41145.1 hypothetical protein E8Q33_10135 [Methylophaga sp. SB9B]